MLSKPRASTGGASENAEENLGFGPMEHSITDTHCSNLARLPSNKQALPTKYLELHTLAKTTTSMRTCLGRQKLGYGMVVDGFAKFQALNFGISGPEISEGFSL